MALVLWITITEKTFADSDCLRVHDAVRGPPANGGCHFPLARRAYSAQEQMPGQCFYVRLPEPGPWTVTGAVTSAMRQPRGHMVCR